MLTLFQIFCFVMLSLSSNNQADVIEALNKTMLLFWIFFVIYVSLFLLSCLFITALWSPAGKESLVGDVFLYFCHFPIWYLGSGVVFDCIDS